ncbi:MAG: AAA family ATPase, partial [Planctomycetaceae bacterium]
MSDTERKLSPAEFLAALNKQNSSASQVSDAAANALEAFDDLDLDELADEDPAADLDAESDDDLSPDLIEDSSDSAAAKDSRLAELFERVNTLLGDSSELDATRTYKPAVPESLEETGLTFEEVERLIVKFLLSKGSATGRRVCLQVCLPFHIVDPILKQLKQEQVLAIKGAAEMGDYEFTITERGRERARRYIEECSYFGSAPVSLSDYLKAMEAQSINKQEASEEDLRNAFADLIISDKMLQKLGPAINSGR